MFSFLQGEKGKGQMKTILGLLLAAVLILSAGLAMADQARNPLAIDIVIAIDNSSRLNPDMYQGKNTIDPMGLRFEAAAALISMCDTQYSRAATFLFNTDLYRPAANGDQKMVTPDQIPMNEISWPKHKSERRDLIETLISRRWNRVGRNSPDIGKAFDAAVQVQMREKNNGNRKVIVLLTTENNNLSEASKKLARQAKKVADENAIEVYAVALADQSQLLTELVSRPDNYQFVSRPEDLVDVYRNFFATMIGSTPEESRSVRKDDKQSEVKITIPNDSVTEVNIILPTEKVEKWSLKDPNGKEIKKTEDNVMVSESNHFAIYKLVQPESQTYTLEYTASEEQDINVQYVFSYGVQVEAEVNAARINKHEPVTIRASYIDKEQPTKKDEKLYKIPAQLTLKKGDKVIKSLQMEHDGNGYYLTFSDLKQYGRGNYSASIHFEGDGLKRDSEPVIFELIDNPPELKNPSVTGKAYTKEINIPTKPESYDPETFREAWDLNSFVKDINGDDLKARIVSKPEEVFAAIESDMTLVIMPKKDTPAEGEIRVIVEDSDLEKSPELVFPVKVTNFENKYASYKASFDENGRTVDKKNTCTLTLHLYNNGKMISQDDQLPDTVTAVVESEGAKPISVKLDKKEDSYWEGSFPTGDHATKYTVTASLKIGNKPISVDAANIDCVNKAPEIRKQGELYQTTINIPRDEDSYHPETHKKTWDLNQFVQDPENDSLKADFVSKPKEVDAKIEGMSLTIMPKKNTPLEGEIRIKVLDDDTVSPGESPELVFQVKVENYENKYDSYTARFDNVGEVDKKSNCTLKLRLHDKVTGEEIPLDDQVPDAVEVTLTTVDKSRLPDIGLTREGTYWTGFFTTGEKETEYILTGQIKVGGKTIAVEEATIRSKNKAPVQKKEPKDHNPWTVNINDPAEGKENSYDQQEQTWSLLDYIKDPDKDDITFTVDKSATTADVFYPNIISDQKLTIKTKLNKETDGDVVVTCKDIDEAEGPRLTFHVTVTSVEEKYKAYTAKLETNAKGKNKEITVTFSVYDERGMLVTGDTNLPDQFDATYTLEKVETPLPLQRGKDGKWTGTFKTTDREANYILSAAVPVSKNVSIPNETPATYSFSTEIHAPTEKKDHRLCDSGLIPGVFYVEPFLIWNNETGDIVITDMNEFFFDEDDDELTFRVTDQKFGDDEVEAVFEKNSSKLIIRGLKETAGEISFTITAEDNEGLTGTSQPISFSVKSLKKQGIIILILIAAALLVLFIIYQAAKPAFHNQYFEVFTKKAGAEALLQGKSSGMKGKKPLKLGNFTTASAKQACGTDVSMALLNKVTLKPAYGNCVKVRLAEMGGAKVKVGATQISAKKAGTVSPNGVLSIENNGMEVQFRLQKPGPQKPVTPSGGNPRTPAAGPGNPGNSTATRTSRT